MYIGDRTTTVLRSQRFATQQTIGEVTTNFPYDWKASKLFAWQRLVPRERCQIANSTMSILWPSAKSKGLF